MRLYQFEDTKALHSLTCCPELPVCKPLSSLLPPRVSAFDKRAHKGEGTLTSQWACRRKIRNSFIFFHLKLKKKLSFASVSHKGDTGALVWQVCRQVCQTSSGNADALAHPSALAYYNPLLCTRAPATWSCPLYYQVFNLIIPYNVENRFLKNSCKATADRKHE